MKYTALIMALAAVIVSEAPAWAQSEAIKSMSRTPNGPTDVRECVEEHTVLEKRISYCESAVRAGHIQVRLELARLYAVKGNFDDALVNVERVFERDGGIQEIDELQSEIYAEMGRFDDAKKVADSMQKGPADEYAKLNEQCWIRAVAGKELDQGLAACNQALSLRPHKGDLFDSRGLIYFKMGRFQDALNDYNAALDEDRHLDSSRYTRGVVKTRLGDAQGGKKDMDDAVERNAIIAQQMARFGVAP